MKHLNYWIFAYNVFTNKRLLQIKKFDSFAKKKTQNNFSIRMVLENDKKAVLYQSLLKNFYINLSIFYEKYISKKYFSVLMKYYQKRKEMKKKEFYLKDLFGSRSAICFLKIWQMKSCEKISFYKRTSTGMQTLEKMLKKLYAKKLFLYLRKIHEMQEKEQKAQNFNEFKTKIRVLRSLAIFCEKNKKLALFFYRKFQGIGNEIFLKWKKFTALQIQKKNKLYFIKKKLELICCQK